VEKSTGKIWRAASGKSPFQRPNQQAREELLERTFRKSTNREKRPGRNVKGWRECWENPNESTTHVYKIEQKQIIVCKTFVLFVAVISKVSWIFSCINFQKDR